MQLFLLILALILFIVSWYLRKVAPAVFNELLADPQKFEILSKRLAILFFVYGVCYLLSLVYFHTLFLSILTLLTTLTAAFFSFTLARSMKRP